MVNEKTVKIGNLHNRILDQQTDYNEVHKLFQEGLRECSEKEANRKLISALIERCIVDSIEEQDGT